MNNMFHLCDGLRKKEKNHPAANEMVSCKSKF